MGQEFSGNGEPSPQGPQANNHQFLPVRREMRRIIRKALRPPNNQLLETSLSVREKSWHILARNTREWLKLNQNLSSTSRLAYPDQLASYEFRKGSNIIEPIWASVNLNCLA